MGIVGWLLGWKPRAPKRLRIKEIRYIRDGGTTMVLGWDSWWRRRWITLTQHLFDEIGEFGPPGRLYMDWYLVPMRSELERDILALLRRCLAELRAECQRKRSPPGEEDQERPASYFDSPERSIHFLEQVIAFVESDEYGKARGIKISGEATDGPLD